MLSARLAAVYALEHATYEVSSQKLTAQDRALTQELVYGVLRFKPRLLYIANLFLKKNVARKDKIIESVILVGLYQLIYLRIPTHAAIYETVELCSKVKKRSAKSLVNAVLQNFLRQKDSISWQDNEEAYFAHPKAFIAMVKSLYPKQYQQVLLANLEHPPLSININLHLISRESYSALLDNANIAYKLLALSGIEILTPIAINDLPGFNEGYFIVQDIASQWAPYLLQLQPGQRLLDACSAPGGKLIACLARYKVDAYAIEVNAKRLDRLTNNLARTHLNANLINQDANLITQWWDGKFFDRILLDAPCSASGIIRRHPEIKYKDFASDTLSPQQLQLLTNLWQTLKPGGLLLYSTCSILAVENDAIIASFLSATVDAQLIAINMPYGQHTRYGIQLLPGEENGDGFYYSCLGKVS